MTRVSIAAILMLIFESASPAQTTTTYSYDALGRLRTTGDNNGIQSTYSLDAAGNRTTVTTANQFATTFEAESLAHQVGFAEANGWAADTSTPTGFMTFGPYTTSVPTGPHVAAWRMMIDNNVGTQDVVHIEVRDNNTNETLAVRSIVRSDWQTPNTYQVFTLPFTMDASRAGHGIEFRTLQFGIAHILIDKEGY